MADTNPVLLKGFAVEEDSLKEDIPAVLSSFGWSLTNSKINGKQLNTIFNQIFGYLNFLQSKGLSFWQEDKPYVATASYKDIVRRGNKIYLAKQDSNPDPKNNPLPKAPESNPDYWGLILDLDNPPALVNHNHNEIYALLTGSATQSFKVKSATANDEAVSLSQANNLIISQKGRLGTQQGTLNSSFTLSSGYVGKLLVCAGGITITLPAINTITSGDLFIIRNDGIDEINISLNGNSTTLGLNTITGGETIILQSDGGSLYREVSRTSKIPAYEDLATTMAYNTVYRANTDITVNVRCTGIFMNGIQLVVGKTTTPTRVIHRFGDDINNNTKRISFEAVISAGMYWKVEPYGSYGFETVEIIEYKHK